MKCQQRQRNDDFFNSLEKKMTLATGAKRLKATCTPKGCEDNFWELTHLLTTRSTKSWQNLSSVWTLYHDVEVRMQRKWARSMEAVDGTLLHFKDAVCDGLTRATNVFVVEAKWGEDGRSDQSQNSCTFFRSCSGEIFRKVFSFHCHLGFDWYLWVYWDGAGFFKNSFYVSWFKKSLKISRTHNKWIEVTRVTLSWMQRFFAR